MSASRILVLIPALFVAACASTTPPQQLASKDCKVGVAVFAGKPKANVSAAEQAEAELRVNRLSFAHGGGGYGPRNNVLSDVSRECN